MEFALILILLGVYTTVRTIYVVWYDENGRELKKIKSGIDFIKNKQYDEAWLFFDLLIRKNPKNPLAYSYRGKCHLAMGNYYGAVADCTKATSFNKEIPEAYLDKGIALYQLSMYKEALLELDKAVWHLRKSATAFRWRGMAKTMLNMPEKAETDFKKAVELGDEHANYYLMRKGKLEI